MRREAGASGTALSGSREAVPPNALKSYDKARSYLMDQKPDKAERELEKAVEAYPGFAEAWYQLGKLQTGLESPDCQDSRLRKPRLRMLNFVSPYEQLAAIAAQQAKWKDVLDNTRPRP